METVSSHFFYHSQHIKSTPIEPKSLARRGRAGRAVGSGNRWAFWPLRNEIRLSFSRCSLDRPRGIIAFDAGYQMSYKKPEMKSRPETLIERKSRMPQIQGVKGEAVVNYAEPLTTP